MESAKVPVARLLLWLISVSALVWCALSWQRPFPSPLELSIAFGGLFLYATLGVLWPQCGMYGDARARGKAGARNVALTFDDGPHPVTTRAVLEILAAYDVRATFFVLGHKVEAHPDVVREIRAAGHALGVHGFQHDHLFSLRSSRYALAQIERAQRAIADACGVTPNLFRPPIGFASHLTFRGAERAAVQIIAWSVRSLDGLRSARPERVAERVIRNLEDGAIVLLHDAAERDDFTPASIAALPAILEALRERAYHAVTVDELPS
ncbi:MAG TPA: polysaccharide deacetylase family protein [Polyangiaceae bacterium]|nr:polysaccharide deacetylase family protein [Polyangiaceae bacterium]